MQTKPADRGAARDDTSDLHNRPWTYARAALENLKSLAWAVSVALLVRVVLFEAFEIEGPSMEPGLLYGDRVIVAKYPYGLFLPLRDRAVLNWGSPEPGDVVVLASPVEDVDIIKRVIGVAGDTVEIRDEVLYRNGQALPLRQLGPCHSGYGENDPMCRVFGSEVDGHPFRTSMAGPMQDLPRVRVPPQHVFVMGDHRDMSNDSRNPDLGPIAVERIKGRGMAVYWSRGNEGIRWSRLFSKLQ